MDQQAHLRESSLSPVKTVSMVLAITFVMEAIVMLVLPRIMPGNVGHVAEALVDATLLTLLTAPAIWWVIIGPLQRLVKAERLRASAIIESAADGIITTNTEGQLQSLNPAAELIFGVTKEKVLWRSISHLLTAESWDVYQSHLAESPTQRRLELNGVRPDGEPVPISVAVSVVQTFLSRTVVVVVHDLTQAKRDESELRKRARCQEVVADLGRIALSERVDDLYQRLAVSVRQALDAGYCALFQLIPDDGRLLLRAGADRQRDRILEVSTEIQACRAAGYDPFGDQVVRFNHEDSFLPPGLLPENSNPCGLSVPVEGVSGRRFGALIVFDDSKRTFTDDEIHFLQAAAAIVTMAIEREWNEIRRREHATIKADQAAAVSMIATGVAHELRNPLTSIKMLVQSSLADDEPVNADDMRLIVEEVRRMETSLNTFLEYARPVTPRRRVIDLRVVVEGFIPLIQGRAGKQCIHLNSDIPDSPVAVDADIQQIRQVLMNLTLNAFDAMGKEGTLSLSVDRHDGWAALSVANTGPHVPDDVWLRMFEPFFTTKETGTGLGLVVSRRIAEDHNGRLKAERRDQFSTTFVLELPLLDDEALDRHHA